MISLNSVFDNENDNDGFQICMHWFVNSQMNQIILYLSKNTVTITISFIPEW